MAFPQAILEKLGNVDGVGFLEILDDLDFRVV